MRRPALRRRRGRAAGFTLIEMLVALTILALLATLALPSMGRQLERHRVQAAAETLAADMTEARFEAARRGLPLHLEPRNTAGGGWCWAVTTAPHCDCGVPQVCQLKVVQAADFRGVALAAAEVVRFDADGRADRAVSMTLASGVEQVRVEVGILGRARVCDPSGQSARLPRCS